ncbi:aldo/keto reductase [Streptomyces sp. 3MP-14]|uniref:Aldo/keto reductase n=1 Tax=Streptomyces mimosae TaxID=2586635 RepID=A0A5N5ZUI4_9ACTN|nr:MULTISPECIES: aldo/keto reductase [Streptomyces]KAB8159542.1 aldo/keto reductase [Streptomyces mimosae]KAB8172820.1 aldo/keto reductase [Streptomyces sp. 3MP-14]
MRYTRLGATGLEVSEICLGCMSFGVPERGPHPWSLDEETSRPLIRQAIEAGITFFDTANVYSDGTSEEITGRALADFARRDEVVIATKVFGRMRPGPNGAGLSRKAILAEIDHSLRRLGTDYVDLYQIHRFDPDTPIDETMEALHDVVKAGKARYLGASSMPAWQFAKAQFTAERHGWTRFVSMQNHYNLIYREEEREMLPLCADQGVGVIPWSPLARGRLTRPWDEAATARSATDVMTGVLYQPGDRQIVERVLEIAERREVPPARVALAWVQANPTVTAPIVGATAARHIEDAVAATELTLTEKEIARLNEPYTPHAVAGVEVPLR